MYTKYTYVAGASQANVLSDIVALLTGTTDKATLSAACDQTNTEILTGWKVAGWTLHDASAGTNAKAIKQAYLDDAATYVYCVIDVNTANKVLLKGYRTWDAGAHTGTDLCYQSDSVSYCPQVNLAAGGQLYLSSSNGHLHITSYQSAIWGSSTGNGSTGIFQRTRLSPWDTVARGYAPFVWMNLQYSIINGQYAYSPRYKKYDGTDVTGSSAICYVTNPWGGIPGNAIPSTAALELDENLNQVHAFLPLAVHTSAYVFRGGVISFISETYETTSSYGGALDEVAKDGNTYVVWSGGSYRIALRKG